MTGLPIAVMDGGPITAVRTAAVSGVAIRRFAPTVSGRPIRAALIGAGVQGRSHLAVLGGVLPGVEVGVFDPSAERLESLAALGRETDGIAAVRIARTARDAVAGADVVVTAAAFGPLRQVMTNDWLEPDALVVPVDYATYCSAEVARDAALFLIDNRGQLEAGRASGLFDGYPEPALTIGEAIVAETARPAHGRVVAMHLGVGLADVVFGSAILARATELGPGSRPAALTKENTCASSRLSSSCSSWSWWSRLVARYRVGRLPDRSRAAADDRLPLPGRRPGCPGHRRAGPDRDRPDHRRYDPHDLFLAQGYVHAQERMWQMEVWRHISAPAASPSCSARASWTRTRSSGRSAGARRRSATSRS